MPRHYADTGAQGRGTVYRGPKQDQGGGTVQRGMRRRPRRRRGGMTGSEAWKGQLIRRQPRQVQTAAEQATALETAKPTVQAGGRMRRRRRPQTGGVDLAQGMTGGNVQRG